jgi:hypothetical protein
VVVDVLGAAAISAGSGLLGAVIGAGASLLTQRAERDLRERSELVSELAALGFAIDMLELEISRLPRRTVFARAADQAISRERLPNLNYLIEWTHFKTVGREAYRAIERFVEVANRVVVVAPDEVLEITQDFAELIGTLQERHHGDAWRQRWNSTRERYAQVCRSAVR